MTIATAIQGATSGDNLTTHVLTAASLGTALSEVTVWLLQLAHVPPPDSIDVAIGTICTFLASYLMQKLSA